MWSLDQRVAAMGMLVASINALRNPRLDPNDMVVERPFPGFVLCICVFLQRPQDDEGSEMGRRWIFDVYQTVVAGSFSGGVKKNDDGVCRLQWDDFYMLKRGLTPVKVMVENRFRMVVK